MRRRIMLVSVWAGGTLVAVLLATFAVSLAGAKVTEHSLRPISHERADDEITESVADRERRDIITLPTTTAPEGSSEAEASSEVGSGEPHDASAARSGPGSGSPSGGGAGASGTPGASPSTSAGGGGQNGGSSGGGGSPGGPSTPSSSSSGGGGSPGGPGPSNSSGGGPGPSGGGGGGGGQGPSSGAPTTTAAAPVRTTYSLAGGSVIVTCTGSFISASASPNPGYATDPSSQLGGGGATQIEVKFRQVAGEHESELKAVCVGGRPQPEVHEG